MTIAYWTVSKNSKKIILTAPVRLDSQFLLTNKFSIQINCPHGCPCENYDCDVPLQTTGFETTTALMTTALSSTTIPETTQSETTLTALTTSTTSTTSTTLTTLSTAPTTSPTNTTILIIYDYKTSRKDNYLLYPEGGKT